MERKESDKDRIETDTTTDTVIVRQFDSIWMCWVICILCLIVVDGRRVEWSGDFSLSLSFSLFLS